MVLKLGQVLRFKAKHNVCISDSHAPTFGAMESIKDRRERMGLTQRELAEKVGKHFSHICHIERGHADPSFEVCVKLTEALDVSPNRLFEMLKMRTTKASVTDIQKERERRKRR